MMQFQIEVLLKTQVELFGFRTGVFDADLIAF